VIMTVVADRRDAWVGLSSWPEMLRSEPWLAKAKTINESEMALFSECTPQCAQKEFDTADIVGDASFRQLSAVYDLVATHDPKSPLLHPPNGVV
jgi:hypothetical protein